MSEVLAPALALGMLVLIYRILLRPRSRWAAFSPVRARMRANRATTPNGLLMLAAVNLAALGWELITEGSTLRLRGAAEASSLLVLVLCVTLLVLMVVSRSLADLLTGLVGVMAALTSAYLRGGLPAVLTILALSIVTLLLLGLIRGFLRPM